VFASTSISANPSVPLVGAHKFANGEAAGLGALSVSSRLLIITIGAAAALTSHPLTVAVIWIQVGAVIAIVAAVVPIVELKSRIIVFNLNRSPY